MAMASSCIALSYAAMLYAEHTAGVTFANVGLLASVFAGHLCAET